MNEEKKYFDAFIKSYLFSLKYLQDFISAPASDYKISFDQYLILHEIKEATGDLTLMEIASRHRVSRSAISRQISSLMDRGFVIQKIDSNDRRRKILQLTAEGNNVEGKLLEAGLERAHDWLKIFGANKLSDVLKFIDDFSTEVISKEETYFSDRINDKKNKS
ncbi:MarR family transcriptional regulator [Paucilactobacillus oligofermentans DSM 15707 = LMG 22743]|uniref:MarR family transcriptional regulator n=1 Tax=Paucilactobacillus oligofermentans DSM 15707 = LMG 22743 TaxID=1423778 RepID=A0A0R1RGH9_9LACO|nr:MarR family transcriptional regulator [Paucilactobacillus oligofermentans]KRL55481.1 MarR family transcriptional regulator [Paucilactobacillus oligofermentans DSM 15707 = LMG 22743]CUS25534.1 MarR family transcriptional regulator [Paucilactobacillus oligofermentans DSM 15707 = LMG 22743]